MISRQFQALPSHERSMTALLSHGKLRRPSGLHMPRSPWDREVTAATSVLTPCPDVLHKHPPINPSLLFRCRTTMGSSSRMDGALSLERSVCSAGTELLLSPGDSCTQPPFSRPSTPTARGTHRAAAVNPFPPPLEKVYQKSCLIQEKDKL